VESGTDLRNSYLLLLVRVLPALWSRSHFTSYIVIEKRELTVSVAFTAISLFSMLAMPLNVIPTYVSSGYVVAKIQTHRCYTGSDDFASPRFGQAS